MSEEEDYDELPPVSVNSSTRESSFSMPCASELATQRAREEECELEIRRMREDHAKETEDGAARVAHSDSSGSEGEAALAAAVSALRVRAPESAAPGAAALLGALAPLLPPAPLLAAYLAAARAAPPHALAALDDHIAAEIGDAACRAADAGEPWEGADAAAAGAWLCCALAARARRRGARVSRAAHLLLGEAAGAGAAGALLAALRGAPAPWDARARLALADALRGGGARCEAAAGALVRGALPAAGAWRRLDAAAQYAALQAAGRMRAHEAAGPLDALAAALPLAKDHRPDTLKVVVAATKLQMLFNVKK